MHVTVAQISGIVTVAVALAAALATYLKAWILKGWILPVFLVLELITLLVLPTLQRQIHVIHQFLHTSIVAQQVILLAVAVVVGPIVSAAQAPLYRVLEGYAFWPAKVAQIGINRQLMYRNRLEEAQSSTVFAGQVTVSGLLYSRVARYPASAHQFAPTAPGNAIRRFETYAGDRYLLDSQLLWHHLETASPPSVVNQLSNARANVDFFVCLVYGGGIIAVLSSTALTIDGISLRPVLAIAIGILLSTFALSAWPRVAVGGRGKVQCVPGW